MTGFAKEVYNASTVPPLYVSFDGFELSERQKMYKTPVKWPGGKRQLLKELDKHFPQVISRYYEPFCGGASVFFHLCSTRPIFEAYLSDMNEDLIATFQTIQEYPHSLCERLSYLKSQHNEEYYYFVRGLDPDDMSPTDRAARFVYLNKTAFNGLVRYNSKGKFNAPFGAYKNPGVYEEDVIMAASKALRRAIVWRTDYKTALSSIQLGKDVVLYADPPYYTEGKNFTSYTKEGFTTEDQIDLAQKLHTLSERGVHVVASNTDHPYVRELYKDFELFPVQATRRINSNGEGRGAVGELIMVRGK